MLYGMGREQGLGATDERIDAGLRRALFYRIVAAGL
jgi:hypothetical protein